MVRAPLVSGPDTFGLTPDAQQWSPSIVSSSIPDLTAALRERIGGPVLVATDPDYATEVAGQNTAVVQAPDVVVGVTSVDDAVAVVRVAREHGFRVRVQGTGHGAEQAITDGVLITTRRLDGLTIDAGTRIATIGAGSRWRPVVEAAAEFGLAPITGSAATVGVVGYLLGGGVGPLARSHGFSSDYVLGFTVVTGQGDLVEVDADHHPDLFWALRGGKTGLGIVVQVRVRLVELATLYGGSLFFAEADIETALRAWVDWMAGADPQVTTSAAIIQFPPFETVPPPMRGRRLLTIRFGYPGSAEDGARLAAPLRAVAPVYLDFVGEMPASQASRIHNDPTEPGPSWVTGMLLAGADQAFVSALLPHTGVGTRSPFVLLEIRHLGSATHRDVPGGSAVSGRGVDYSLMLIAAGQPTFGTAAVSAAAIIADIQPWISAETNPNYPAAVNVPAASAGPSAGAAERTERLTKIRRHYDPDGILG